MWHLKIPKRALFYWDGGKLPHLRYLAIETFRYYNPDWEIIVYIPSVIQTNISWSGSEQKYGDNYIDCFDKIKNLGVTIKEINLNTIGFYNEASAVHKSDYLRWWLLYTSGGLWIDMDIIFIKPMDDLYFNKPELSNINVVFCISNYGHSIGFLMGDIGNDYFKIIHQASKQYYNKDDYQCMGSLLCNKLFPTVTSAQRGNIVSHNLSMEVVYSYDANHAKELFKLNTPTRLTDKSIGMHWYGGHETAGEYLNATNGGLYNKDQSIIDKYIKEFINLQNIKQEKKDMKISVVMAFYNRQALLNKTLESLDKSAIKDYELIIIDDASIVPLVCPRAKVIRVERNDKWYTASTVAHNRALREATGDIVVLQNPECYHIGDILAYVKENIKPNTYLSFGCYAISDIETNNFHNGIMPAINDYIFTGATRNGWYNHTKHRPVAYHFCSAIMRKDLDRIGGFDERYAHGVAFDDDDFIRRIKYMGMDVRIVNNPYVIHQYHTHFEFESPVAWRAPHDRNQRLYNEGYRADIPMGYSRNTDLFAGEGGDWDLLKNNYDRYFVNYSGDRTPVIPRNLHMIWLGGEVPTKNTRFIETWKHHHPNWNFKIWNDKDAEEFGMINKSAYDNISNVGIKSAVFRYEILYRHGGIYVDMDFECLKPFDDLLYLDFFAGGRDLKPIVAEGLLASKQGGTFIKKVIDGINIRQNAINTKMTDNLKDICWEYVTEKYLEYIKTTMDKTVLFPDAFFYPMPNSFRHEIREDTDITRSRVYSYIKPNTYCIHMWYTSWLPMSQQSVITSPNIISAPIIPQTHSHSHHGDMIKIYPGGHKKIIRPKLTRAQRLARDARKKRR